MRYWIACLFLALGIVACQARGGITASGAGACPFAGTASADGCSTALVTYASGGLSGASINRGRSAFFGTGSPTSGGYAQQAGQTYPVASLPQWNVAGVDYTVGVPSTVTLQDPALASLPTGCSYSAGGITCSGGTCVNPTLQNLDLTLHSGVWVDIKSTCTGTITIKNNKWVNGSNSQAQIWAIQIETGSTANVVVQNNYFDHGTTYQNPKATIWVDTTGTLTSKYNVYLNMSAAAIISTVGNQISQYDYFEGASFDGAWGYHGELNNVCPPSGQTTPLVQYTYTTYIGGANYGGGMTTTVYDSGGATCTGTITTSDFENNVWIQNPYVFTGYIDNGSGSAGNTLHVTALNTPTPSQMGLALGATQVFGSGMTNATITAQNTGATLAVGTYTINGSAQLTTSGPIKWGPSSAAGVEWGYATYGTVTVKNNYIDPSGALYCFIDGTSSIVPTMSGNVNLTDGSSIPDFTRANCHNHAP